MTLPGPDHVTASADLAKSRPATLLQRLLALALAATAIFLAARFPTAPLALALGLCAYLLVSLRFADAWLLVVPALLPLLYLAPWSGRVFFDEFDLLLLCSLAAALWHGRAHSRHRRMSSGGRVALALFTLVYLHALWRGLSGIGELDFNSLASYYSPLNALRIGKGFFWALALYPALIGAQQEDRARSNRLLTTGLLLGMSGVAAVVLRERGVLHDMVYYQGLRQLLDSLLDFGTSYRITALFADMHTGGEAIDGYLSLVWPFAALTLVTARTRWHAAFAAAVTLAAFYAMVVTFSRGVYFSFGVVVFTACMLGVMKHWKSVPARLFLVTALYSGASVIAAILAFRAGGIAAILACILGFATGAGYVFGSERGLASSLLRGLATSSALGCAAIAAYAAITSKWAHMAPGTGISLAVSAAVLFALAGAHLNHGWRGQLGTRNRALASLLLCAAIAAFVPSLFGSRMEQRFATTTQDLQHRVAHWRDAVAVMDDDWNTRILGQGVGRFPERYYWVKQQARDVGGFVFRQEGGNAFLQFAGAHDVRLGQRVALQPGQAFRLTLDVRTRDPEADLHLRFCHRHLIHPTEWNPACVDLGRRVKDTQGEWQHLEFDFNSGDLGALELELQSPLVLELANRREYDMNTKPQTLLDFDNLTLRHTVSGEEILRNGDFEHGIDHWFGYYDFNHLPWHIKNLWVNVYFELGIAGLVAFVLLLSTSIRGLLTQTSGDAGEAAFSIAVLLALVGFVAVGTFGTMLDIPRVTFLFFLLLLCGLTQGASPRTQHMRRRAQGALPQGESHRALLQQQHH